MDNTPKAQPRPRLTIAVLALMLIVGAIIVFLDRDQMVQLAGKAEWHYLGIAMGFVTISYFLQSFGIVIMLKVFGVGLNQLYLLRIGLVSSVISNLIALPAALGLQVLVLGRRGVTQNQILGASLLLSFFKNLVFYALIPLSLVYVIFTFPLVFGGVITMIFLIIVLVIAIIVATVIVFNPWVRLLVLKLVGHIWHFVTRRNIQKSLNNFEIAITQGFSELKRQPKTGLLMAAIVLGDVTSMITALWFCFKALAVAVHLGVLITGFNFGITLTVISFIPGDLGVQEASIAGILAIFGVPFAQTILVAILFRVLYYFVPFVFSLGFYWSLLRESVKEIE